MHRDADQLVDPTTRKQRELRFTTYELDQRLGEGEGERTETSSEACNAIRAAGQLVRSSSARSHCFGTAVRPPTERVRLGAVLQYDPRLSQRAPAPPSTL